MLARFAAAALDLLLPSRCPACGEVVGTPDSFCAPCWVALLALGDPACPRCAEPMPAGTPPGECLRCLADPPAFGETRAVARYDGSARELLLRLKNGGEHLAGALGRGLRARAGDWLRGETVLVPVPLHPSRLAKRGFNQAGWLARAAAEGTPARVELDWLIRRRATGSTHGLTRAQRLREATGAYAVPRAARAAVKGAHVLLVDDVMTTGATLRAAARPLKRAGATSVRCLVYARVASGRASTQ